VAGVHDCVDVVTGVVTGVVMCWCVEDCKTAKFWMNKDSTQWTGTGTGTGWWLCWCVDPMAAKKSVSTKQFPASPTLFAAGHPAHHVKSSRWLEHVTSKGSDTFQTYRVSVFRG
jgi:hypothetical protein